MKLHLTIHWTSIPNPLFLQGNEQIAYRNPVLDL